MGLDSMIHGLMNQLVPVQREEVGPVLTAAASMFCILASYFVVVPLREDAAIALGTSNLPKLFICSLAAALVLAPVVSSVLNQPTPRARDKSLRRLFLALSATQLVFYLLYTHPDTGHVTQYGPAWRFIHARAAAVTGAPWAGAPPPAAANATAGVGSGASSSAARMADAAAKQMGDLLSPDGDYARRLQQDHHQHRRQALGQELQHLGRKHKQKQQQEQQQQEQEQEQEPSPPADGGGASEAVPAAAGGAGAEAQTGAVGAESGRGGGARGSQDGASGTEPSPPPPMPELAAGGAAGKQRKQTQKQQQQQQLSPQRRLTAAQRTLRGVFYVWVSTCNLLSASALWARCADTFFDSGTRLFGFISAGATLGQLTGSVAALALAAAAKSADAGAAHGAGAANATLILLSSFLLMVTSQLAPRIRQRGGGGGGGGPGTGDGSGDERYADAAPSGARAPAAAATQLALLRKRSMSVSSGGGTRGPSLAGGGAAARTASFSGGADTLFARVGSLGRLGSAPLSPRRGAMPLSPRGATPPPPAGPGPAPPAEAVPSIDEEDPGLAEVAGSQLSQLLVGFRLVAASEYLTGMCCYLLVTYVVGSLLYFERALVVSQALTTTGDRTAFFAWLNSWSATFIALCQLFATASLLRALGVQLALCCGPCVALVGLCCIALRPRPTTVAAVEVVRKVVGYAVTRPAREVLFTVVSRSEKYSAKLVIDVVVQRLGDAIAAGAFQLLDVQLHLGVRGVAAAGCAACALWALAALRVGRLHGRLAVERARRRRGKSEV